MKTEDKTEIETAVSGFEQSASVQAQGTSEDDRYLIDKAKVIIEVIPIRERTLSNTGFKNLNLV